VGAKTSVAESVGYFILLLVRLCLLLPPPLLTAAAAHKSLVGKFYNQVFFPRSG
jgi:hypothetical protein